MPAFLTPVAPVLPARPEPPGTAAAMQGKGAARIGANMKSETQAARVTFPIEEALRDGGSAGRRPPDVHDAQRRHRLGGGDHRLTPTAKQQTAAAPAPPPAVPQGRSRPTSTS